MITHDKIVLIPALISEAHLKIPSLASTLSTETMIIQQRYGERRCTCITLRARLASVGRCPQCAAGHLHLANTCEHAPITARHSRRTLTFLIATNAARKPGTGAETLNSCAHSGCATPTQALLYSLKETSNHCNS